MIETTQVYSVPRPHDAAMTPSCVPRPLPLAAPHRCPTSPLSGGGSALQPGEMSLAHNGVLFLDELPEFSPAVLEALRQPLEDGSVTISRASGLRDVSRAASCSCAP